MLVMVTCTSISAQMTILRKFTLKRAKKFITELYKKAKEVDGNMSGEHGIGYAKEPYFEDYYGKDYVEMLRKIKLAFDPNDVINPDKVFPMHD